LLIADGCKLIAASFSSGNLKSSNRQLLRLRYRRLKTVSENDPVENPDSAHGNHAGPGHERTDADTRKVLMFGVGLAAIILAACLAMWITFGYLNAHQPLTGPPPSPLATERRLPPEPRLQVSETEDSGKAVADEDKWLTSYGWVDKDGGVAHIPIESAMDLILERGIPGGTNESAKSKAPLVGPGSARTPARTSAESH
jgi:hypothetical protein